MNKTKKIRCYDYVNHPFEAVRDALSSDTTTVFRNATKAAALRARTVAAELSVDIAGVQIGTDISISVQKIEQHPQKATSPPVTLLQLEWTATKMPALFPVMKAELSIYPLTATETQLDFLGNYEAPLGVLGGAIDAVVGRRIAEASVHRFIENVAAYLRAELSKPDQQ